MSFQLQVRVVYSFLLDAFTHVHIYRTFASVKGPEEYDFLKACFEPVLKELGDIIADPYVTTGGQQHKLNIVFGSDYKVCCIYVDHNNFYIMKL